VPIQINEISLYSCVLGGRRLSSPEQPGAECSASLHTNVLVLAAGGHPLSIVVGLKQHLAHELEGAQQLIVGMEGEPCATPHATEHSSHHQHN
jgi:hypothetical protein